MTTPTRDQILTAHKTIALSDKREAQALEADHAANRLEHAVSELAYAGLIEDREGCLQALASLRTVLRKATTKAAATKLDAEWELLQLLGKLPTE